MAKVIERGRATISVNGQVVGTFSKVVVDPPFIWDGPIIEIEPCDYSLSCTGFRTIMVDIPPKAKGSLVKKLVKQAIEKNRKETHPDKRQRRKKNRLKKKT